MAEKAQPTEEEAKAIVAIRTMVKSLTGQELSEQEASKLFFTTKEKMVDAMAKANVENVDPS